MDRPCSDARAPRSQWLANAPAGREAHDGVSVCDGPGWPSLNESTGLMQTCARRAQPPP